MRTKLCFILLILTFPILFFSCVQSKEIESKTLELSIRNIMEMPVIEQIYQDIVYLGEKQKILFITTSDKEVLFSINIRVQAGIKNVSEIKIKTMKKTNGNIAAIVQLPPADFILVDADENSIHQYFIKENGSDIS
ncbi:MAG: DUF4230 domain-containing protein, partial [Spirochaetales bacterium]|nr:DUF4230 domain-containing protein [Spirochaetales bacterium]